MKAVPPHAQIGDCLGQRERLRDRRRAAVEGRVEARHLRHLRQACEQRPDRGKVVRLVERGQRNVFFQRRHDRRIETHRLRVLEAAVHHAVTDARQAMPGELRAKECDQMFERAFVAEFIPFTPRFFAKEFPVPSLATNRGAVDRPSACPRAIRSNASPRSTNTENLRLDEPAFKTTIASFISAPARPPEGR